MADGAQETRRDDELLSLGHVRWRGFLLLPLLSPPPPLPFLSPPLRCCGRYYNYYAYRVECLPLRDRVVRAHFALPRGQGLLQNELQGSAFHR